MALQLTGAGKQSAMANLQVRLPAIVIGGGLTAIDTATELFAYYPLQVEKILARYETLSADLGEATIRAGYDKEELLIVDELLDHGRAIRAERQRAAAAGEKPDFIPLVRAWGGVTIAYRKSITDSPAYRLNHEEVIKGVRGRDRLRREPFADRSDGRRIRPREVAPLRETDRRRRPLERLRRRDRASGAQRDGGGRHEPERDLREGASGHVQARQVRTVFPELRRLEPGDEPGADGSRREP